jgi:hypothetical protein
MGEVAGMRGEGEVNGKNCSNAQPKLAPPLVESLPLASVSRKPPAQHNRTRSIEEDDTRYR